MILILGGCLEFYQDVEGNAANSIGGKWGTIFKEKAKNQADHKESEQSPGQMKIMII